jgi:hypothetical protein
MTKKSLQILHANKCAIQVETVNLPARELNRYVVSFSLTPGELFAMRHALESYHTVVGQDLVSYFNNAAIRSDIEL